MGRRRGFFATMAQVAREAEREQRRKQRELLAQQRQVTRLRAALDRERERAEAELEAQTNENAVAVLLSVHHECSPAVDWTEVCQAQPPTLVPVDRMPLLRARNAQLAYSPSFFDRVLRRVETRRSALHAETVRVEREIRAAEARRRSEHEAAIREWTQRVELAKRILGGDLGAYDLVLEDSDCFEELNESGCSVAVAWTSPDSARAAVQVPGEDVVPRDEKKINSRGKLSVKNLPATRITEIYQDFICGAALRTARELFAILPLKSVIVDVHTSLLDPSTGNIQVSPVLSVFCPREKFATIKFERADPSSVIGGLRHSMSFKRGKGMDRVELLGQEGWLSVQQPSRPPPGKPLP